MTDENGSFRLETTQIVPAFGQPHGHLAYDSGGFATVFLRPVMPSSGDKTLAMVIAAGRVVDAVLIEGTMETVSKAALCFLVLAATAVVVAGRRVRRRIVPGFPRHGFVSHHSHTTLPKCRPAC